jgi:hypothetical protein
LTVESTNNRNQYDTNGTTGPWTVGFYFLTEGSLDVTYTDADGDATTLTLNTDYTVTGEGDPNGGTVTTTTAYAAGGLITILLNPSPLQETDYVETDSFPAASHERELDRLTQRDLQHDERFARSLHFAVSDTNNAELPTAPQRALKALTFDTDGNPVCTTPAAGTADALAAALLNNNLANTGVGLIGATQGVAYTSGLGRRFASEVFATDQPFGAIGDNSTDCYAAIQAALDYAGTQVQTILTNKVNIVSARVRLGRGRFKVSAPLLIPEGVTLEGESCSSSLILPTHTGIAVQMGSGTREYANVILRNLGIIGNRSGTLSYGLWTTTTTIGVSAINCIRGCSIENCFITQCQTSIKLENSYQFKVKDNYAIYALDYHIETDNLVSGEISGNRLDWSEKDGIFFNGTNVGDATISGVVERNAIQICWRNGIRAYDVVSLEIRSNFFEANYREATSGASHVYADINIETGPNNRGNSFLISCNYFTHGSSPDFDSYTAIRCNKAVAITMIGNVCTDSFYWRMMDVDSVNIGRIIALGNTFSNSNGKIAYDSDNTSGLIEEQDGTGVFTISELRAGGLRLLTTESSSNQDSDDKKTLFLLDCSGGAVTFELQTGDCLSGRVCIVKKIDGSANALNVTTQGAETIDGAASVSSTAAYATYRITSNGTNWFLI